MAATLLDRVIGAEERAVELRVRLAGPLRRRLQRPPSTPAMATLLFDFYTGGKIAKGRVRVARPFSITHCVITDP